MQPITCYVAKRNLSREAWQTDWYNTLTQMFCAHFCLLLSCVLCKYKHGWLRFPSFTSIVTFAVTRQLLWNNVHCVGARLTKPFYLVCYSVFLIVFCFLFFFLLFFIFILSRLCGLAEFLPDFLTFILSHIFYCFQCFIITSPANATISASWNFFANYAGAVDGRCDCVPLPSSS